MTLCGDTVIQNFPRCHLDLILPEIAPFDRRPWKPYPRTKHEMCWITRCGDIVIRVSWRHMGEGEVVGGQRWYHSKERWWFPIGSPLWPLRYLWPFGGNLRSNVSDAQINRGWVTFGLNLGVFPLEQTRHVGVAKSERPKLTDGEIISEEFQPMWSQFTNVTDGQTDRRHAIAIPRFALKCIAR